MIYYKGMRSFIEPNNKAPKDPGQGWQPWAALSSMARLGCGAHLRS